MGSPSASSLWSVRRALVAKTKAVVAVVAAEQVGNPQWAGLGVDQAMGALQAAAGLRHWVTENAKTTRAFLKRVAEVAPLAVPIQEQDIQVLPRPPKGGQKKPGSGNDQAIRALLAPALAGQDVGLMSEAGLPAVADPGSALVLAAHKAGIEVVPFSGPSSLVLALAALIVVKGL